MLRLFLSISQSLSLYLFKFSLLLSQHLQIFAGTLFAFTYFAEHE